MKKLFKGIVALATVLTLASCGEKPTTPDTGDKEIDTSKVLVDENVFGYFVTGPGCMKVGEDFITTWGMPTFDEETNEPSAPGMMTATSIDAVTAINADLGATLKTRKLRGLYTLENINIGGAKLTGSKEWAEEGEKAVQLDGGYQFKIIEAIEEEGILTAKSWIQSPESGKAHSLTPDTFWVNSNYTDVKDDYGRDWNGNPFVTGGAGIYTAVYARYAELVDGASHGIALIKTSEVEEAFAPALHHYQLVGTINGWNINDNAPEVTFDANNELTYTFTAEHVAVKDGCKFKVGKHMTTKEGGEKGDWANGDLGWGAVETESTKIVEDGGNIKVKEACTLKLKVNDAGKLLITEVTNA